MPPERKRTAAPLLPCLAAATCVLSIPTDVRADACVDWEDHLHPVGVLETGERLVGMAVRGDLAYVADVQGIGAWNISDPSTPHRVGWMPLPGDARGAHYQHPNAVEIEGSFVYVAYGLIGVHVVNISNPEAMSLTLTLIGPSACTGLTIHEDHAFVSAGNDLRIIDLDDPAPHSVLTTIPGAPSGAIEPVWEVEVVGNTLYMAEGYAGLQIYDISDLAAPVHRGVFQNPWTMVAVEPIDANHVMVTGDSVLVVNVADPEHPYGVASLDVRFSNGSVLHGTTATVGSRVGHVASIDLSDPADPQLIGLASTNQNDGQLERVGDLVLSLGRERITLWDVSEPSSPTPTQSLRGFRANEIAFDDGVTYVASGPEGLVILDTATGDEISRIETPEDLWSALSVAAADGWAYVSEGGRGLSVVDARDPANPAIAAVVDGGSLTRTHHAVVDGSFVFVADHYDGVVTLDVTNPAAPAEAGFLPSGGTDFLAYDPPHLYAIGAYSTGFEEFVVLDASDPTSLAVIATVPLPETGRRIALAEDRAYVLLWNAWIQIYDITDPANPVWVAETDLGFPYTYYIRDLEVHDGILYAAHGNDRASGGLYVYDLRADRDHPRRLGGCKPRGRSDSRGVSVTADGVWLLQTRVDAGFDLLPRQCPAGVTGMGPIDGEHPPWPSRLSRISPNPTSGAVRIDLSLPSRSDVSLDVYDVSGRLVRRLVRGALPAGSQRRIWNGRDEAGRPVGSGVYFLRMRAGERAETERIVRVR